MKIDLSDDFMKRLTAYNAEHEGRTSLSVLIEDAVDTYMELWPFNAADDVCVHADECMHHKTVAEWGRDKNEGA
jgi:hypothetical protein